MSTSNWRFRGPPISLKKPKRSVPLPDFLKVPSFPSVQELLEQQEKQEVVQRASSGKFSGLFHALLLSHPEALYADAMESPTKYDERVLPLTRDLMGTGREPTEEERTLLDAAMLDFSRKELPPPTPVPTSRSVVQTRVARPRFPETDVADEEPEQASGIPYGQVRPFWWL